MLSRRNFVVTGICSVVSTSALVSNAAMGVCLRSDEPNLHSQKAAINNLSYKSAESYKGKKLQLKNADGQCSAKVVEVHDMNSDYRLEQFSMQLKPSSPLSDISGVFEASMSDELGDIKFPISIIGNQADTNESRYFAVYSRIKSI